MVRRFHPLRVVCVEKLTADAAAVTFEVPADLRDEFCFLPGQHVVVRCPQAGDDKRRTYSLCAPPPTLRIGVKRIPGGVFSGYVLDHLRPGEVVEVMPPTGRFVASSDPGIRRRGAICAGSGITPVLPIMESTLASDPDSRFTLIYGNRSAATVMFLDEIADLKDRYPDRLDVVHVFSREQRESDLLTGRLDRNKLAELFDRLVPAGDIDEWFVCGPVGVIDAAKAELTSRGVSSERIRSELFHLDLPASPAVSPADSADGVATVTVRLSGRTTRLQVPFDTDILHAVLPLRADVPYGCTNGMCGTCRARVVEGRVEMRHCYALDEGQLAAGFVVTCQALPRTATVSVDYDA